MFETIIVGVDGSDEARDALALTRLLADVDPDARVLIVHAFPYDDAPSLGPTPRLEQTLREEAEMLLSELVEDAPTGSRTMAVPNSAPARALHILAERERAGLLVVGSSRRGTVGQVLVGSTTSRVLHGAPCGVAVAPRGLSKIRGNGLRRVGVGFDGRAESRPAFTLARRLAAGAGAPLEVIRIVPSAAGYAAAAPGAFVDVAAIEAAQRKQARQHLDGSLARIDVPAAAHVVTGSPAVELRRASEFLDLLVVGSRGRGPLSRVLMGSTSDALARNAACAVIVVPRMDDLVTAKHPYLLRTSRWGNEPMTGRRRGPSVGVTRPSKAARSPR